MIHDYGNLRQGLVGAWCPSLGATGYTLLDRSGYGNHGTLTNMGGQANWRASGGAVALNLDGSNDYVVNASPTYSVAFPFSISIWFNISSAYRSASLGRTYLVQATPYSGTRQAIFSIATDYSTATDKLYYFEGNAVRITGQSFTVGTWQHVVFCFDSSSSVRFFLNGIQGTVDQPGGFATLGPAALYVGGLDGTLINCPALVDDIRFYRRSLTPSDVAQLASRRGIGLTPRRSRRPSAGSLFSLNVGGTWKSATPWVNVGGTWKQATAYTKQGGVWK